MVLRYKCELVAYQFTILYRCGAPTNDYARATRPSNPTPDIIISRCALRHVICFVGLFVCGQMCYDHTLSVYIGDRPLRTIAGQALGYFLFFSLTRSFHWRFCLDGLCKGPKCLVLWSCVMSWLCLSWCPKAAMVQVRVSRI